MRSLLLSNSQVLYQPTLAILQGLEMLRVYRKHFNIKIKLTRNMYTGYKVNQSLNKSSVSALKESQVETLQRDVDVYTRKLEQQKRKYFAVQDQHKAVSEEYQKEKEKLNQLKKQTTRAETIQLHSKVKNLEANLDKAISSYDDTIAHNNKLKNQIDRLRRQKKNYLEMQKSLTEQAKKLEEESDQKTQILEKKRQKVLELKKQMEDLKQRNQQERLTYLSQFENIQKEYLQQRDTLYDVGGSRANSYKGSLGLNETSMLSGGGTRANQIVDTQPLLRFRLKRLIQSNKEKTHMIDQYRKHMTAIEQAFEEIKTKANITSLEEITTTFIKSEEQNYSLYNYLDDLSQNIDKIEEENRRLECLIQQKQAEVNAESDSNHLLQQYPQQNTQNSQKISKTFQGKQQLADFVYKVKPLLESTLVELADSPLIPNQNLTDTGVSRKKSQDYHLGLNVNERNIEEYLSELERHVNALLVAKEEAKTKTVTQVKDQVTVYSKPIPSNLNYEELVREKSTNVSVLPPQGGNQSSMMGGSKEEGRFMEEKRLREFAAEFWQKRRGNQISNSNFTPAK